MSDPLAFRCSFCGAEAGAPCRVAGDADRTLEAPHKERVRLAESIVTLEEVAAAANGTCSVLFPVLVGGHVRMIQCGTKPHLEIGICAHHLHSLGLWSQLPTA